MSHRGDAVLGLDAVDEAEVDDVDAQLGVDHVAHGLLEVVEKDVSPTDLREGIRHVAAGDALLSPAITGTVVRALAGRLRRSTRPELVDGLTEREREVLRRIALGESNAEVGAALCISPATARTYVSRVLAKLGARDRAQLVVIAYESGLATQGASPD